MTEVLTPNGDVLHFGNYGGKSPLATKSPAAGTVKAGGEATMGWIPRQCHDPQPARDTD